MKDKPPVLCIVGPTACGKTSLSVELAKCVSGEIVSADAVAVYRGLDIGSAKPSLEERQGVAHHMIDCVDLADNSFSVSAFREAARACIDDILARGKLPILVGGSGLYVDAVFSDMRFSAPSDPEIRARVEREYDEDQTAVFETLRRVDGASAERLHPNDRKRVVRALEVFLVSGRPFSELNDSFESAQKNDGTYRTVRLGLIKPRDVLYNGIDRRVDRMISAGLTEEAFDLFRNGFTPDRYKAMQSIGYAQLYPVFCGETSLQEAIDRIKQDTRRFAKRQITWFKRNRETIWFDTDRLPEMEIINQVLELLK